MVLSGTHPQKMDDKGRLILPAKVRAPFEGSLYLTLGQENCLYVFSKEEFEAMYKQLSQIPMTDRQGRNYARMFLAGAVQQNPDKQWRITIPQYQRDYAGLGRELVVIGAGNKLEIWDSAAWQEFFTQGAMDYSNISEQIGPGLI